MTAPRAPQVRAFFALWPEPATAAALSAAAPAGRFSVAPEDLHLTLAFLGLVAVADLGVLAAFAADSGIAPFALRLTAFEAWPGALVALPEATPPALVALRARLINRLAASALAPAAADELRFRAHVTLARRGARDRAQAEGRLARAVDWTVAEVTLATSEPSPDGRRYRRVARLALGKAADA